jgi:porin
VGEVYFRWKIGRHFEVTPNLQLLIDPALNPAEDTIWVFGLRAKGSL